MEYGDLITLARRGGRSRFMIEFGNAWFLARVDALEESTPPASRPAPDDFEFDTMIGSAALRTMQWDTPLAPLVKRPGNPFPERVSIGRAGNCDVVLRLPYVSKLHAHVFVDTEPRAILDLGSSRGTTVNRVRLKPHVGHPLALGDQVTFGSQKTLIIGASEAFETLRHQRSGLRPATRLLRAR